MRDFVLEIGCEEIPARFAPAALATLERLAAGAMETSRISVGRIRAFGTPRRLALIIEGVSERQEDQVIEVKGPPEAVAFEQGTPGKAAEGFARSQGVDVDDLVVHELPQGRYVFARRFQEGKDTREVLASVLSSLVEGLDFPKSMRWGEGEFRFARPIRWIMALFGDEPLDFHVAGLRSGRLTRGHRFAHPEPVGVRSAGEYVEVLRGKGVLVDPEERLARVSEGVECAAREAGGRAILEEDLLREVTFLVEDPVAFWGSFDDCFLALPVDVLTTCMKHHQKYFPIEAPGKGLLPRFVGVTNGGLIDIDMVRAGNERVLRARLADARFFFDEDRSRSLEQRLPGLERVTFQETLGSMGEKTRRLEVLVKQMGNLAQLDDGVVGRACRAAGLSKADLTTHMVVEFPELQGIMGREYALRSGEDPRVAAAISEHYLPRFSGDALPDLTEGMLLAIADKADTVTGCFLAGIQPTGSSDPYGLRRQAFGVVLCLLESGLRLRLRDVLESAATGYGQGVPEGLEEFFLQRLRGLMSEKGFGHDIIEAVLVRGTGYLSDTLEVAVALEAFLRGEGGGDLLTAHRRSANLAGKSMGIEIDPSLFEHESEGDLLKWLERTRGTAMKSLEDRRYDLYFSALASLKAPVDRLLEGVLVMAPDERLRQNRLALLRSVADLLGGVVDLGRLHLEGTAAPGE